MWGSFLGVLAFLIVIPAASPLWAASGSTASPSEVLTLWEAADYLKIPLREAVRLANEGQFPGRRVGKYWRVTRQALHDWVAQGGSHQAKESEKAPPSVASAAAKATPPPPTPSSPERQSDPGDLSDASLAAIAGRGTGGENTEQEAPDAIGEAPEGPSAEQMFLRDQEVLLMPNQATLEFGFFYSRTEQDGLTVLVVNNTAFLASSFGEQDLYVWNFTGRYGLPYDIQFFANLPLIHTEDTITANVPNSTISEDSSRDLTETGNLVLGFRRTMVREQLGIPSIILSIEGTYSHSKTVLCRWGRSGVG